MTTVVLAFAFRDRRPLFWAYLPVALGLYAATLDLRLHYAVDVIAGFATAALAVALAPRINRAWYTEASNPA
jgi:membrane-associated phospholipid phosphatase